MNKWQKGMGQSLIVPRIPSPFDLFLWVAGKNPKRPKLSMMPSPSRNDRSGALQRWSHVRSHALQSSRGVARCESGGKRHGLALLLNDFLEICGVMCCSTSKWHMCFLLFCFDNLKVQVAFVSTCHHLYSFGGFHTWGYSKMDGL